MNKWFLIGVLVFTVAVIGAAVIISGSGSPSDAKAVLEQTNGSKIAIDHMQKTVGNIPYSGGILYHSFPIQNTGTKDLKIANLGTSCHCTKAFLRIGKTDGPEFGMKGSSVPSNWTGILKPGEKGEIIAAFDPAFHGPAGIGSVTRIISFETNDPNHSYVEVSFDGVVIK